MAEPVKSRRRYESPRRREQAEATRRAILDAARLRFERDGYVATTIAAIAEEANVSAKTIYTAFETKSGVLRALWHLLLRGDEEERPVGERGWFQEVLDEPDPERQLRLNARNARRVKARAGAMLGVIRDAAAVDADAAALWARIESDFHANQGAVVASIDAKGALRPGLGADRATDVLWTLNHPDVWLLLAGRGWTPEEFESWFADASCAELLGPSVSSPVAG
jgi:AcrR family transcriptional regulator